MDSWEEQAYREITKNEFPHLIEMLERVLDFKRWKFKPSYSGWSNSVPPSLIYDSPWCRVRFTRPIQDERDGDKTILIRYGRLHAPSDRQEMRVAGKPCHCWHDVFLVLEFLDGLSPQAAVDKNLKRPQVMQRFYEARDPAWIFPEFLARLHAEIWQHYGERFFEVFDLRHPNPWAGYVHFVEEYRRLSELQQHYAGPWPSDIC